MIDKGQLKNEKIAATYVVLPGGVKFMKLLLKIIKIVLGEVNTRKKIPENEMKKPVAVFIEEIDEKCELLSSFGVEIKKYVEMFYCVFSLQQ